jgi:hypothetical protein
MFYELSEKTRNGMFSGCAMEQDGEAIWKMCKVYFEAGG